MNALSYPVTLKYLATTDGYTSASPHKGVDFGAPEGTPIIVAGVQIGLSGSTGQVTGPHVHVQGGTDIDAQKTVDPTPYVGKAGTVYQTGNRSQWGNFVNILVDGIYVHYCHMSRIDVVVGQVIQGEETVKIENNSQWKTRMGQVLWEITGDELSDDEFKSWVGAEPFSIVEALIDDKKRARKNDTTSDADSRLQAIKSALGL